MLRCGSEVWCGCCPAFTVGYYFKLAQAEKVHSTFLRWHTGTAMGVHPCVLSQAGGGPLRVVHWLQLAPVFWIHLVFSDPAWCMVLYVTTSL